MELFYKSQRGCKNVAFCLFLVRFPMISLFYRECFIGGPINQFLLVKIKLLTLLQH